MLSTAKMLVPGLKRRVAMHSAIEKMQLVKAASTSLANAKPVQRTAALHNIARLLLERTAEIISANAKDLERGVAAGMTA